MKPTVIILTGGIGSGKSVVSHILRVMGFQVYDCDSEAKRIMDSSAEILEAISTRITATAIAMDGTLDRRALAEVVFSDRKALDCLNEIVHGAVRADVESRIGHAGEGMFFIETAIPYESGLDACADEIWEVTAPAEERVGRVMTRNGLTAEQVRKRMASQRNELNPSHKIIKNSGADALLPQILALINGRS